MGKVRTKIMEPALEPEKLEKLKEIEQAEGTKETPEAKLTPKSKKEERPPKVRSTRYKKLLKLVDKSKEYPITEAIELIKKTANTSFDSTIEAHINLGLSADKSEHQIRVHVTLPYPIPSKTTGNKPLRLLVFTDKNREEIKKLGAEIGTDETLKEIEKGKAEFSKLIAEPSWMPKLVKVAKILGPKNLMPNPKAGTVTEDPVTAVKEFSGGKIELRVEKSPIIHTCIGKASQDTNKLKENLTALLTAISNAKPEGFKKQLIKSIYLTSTMGPSVKVDSTTIQA